MHIICSSIAIENSGLHCTFGCATLKYKPMHIISNSIEIENSGLHCTFGCATLKYSLCTLLVVALKLKTLDYTALLGVPP